jgi:hypothetical protein
LNRLSGSTLRHNTMKKTLIIGSGVSYFSDIPGLSSITDSILTSGRIGKGTDTNYYFEGYWGYGIQDYLNGYVRSCQQLLNLIKNKIGRFYKLLEFEHQVNYEDIYYVLRQIQDSFHLEYENPATISLIEELIQDTELDKKNFKENITESVRYIESLVWQSIDIPVKQSSQYNIVKDLLDCFNLDTVLSLNHDLVLENWLHSNNINYDDGFHFDNKKLPEWKGFQNENGILKLCKVHGSIDWFDFRITKPSTYDNLVKIPRNHYAERINEIDDSFLAPNSGKPSILVGTFNKMLGYLGGIHEILYDELKSTIKESEVIIISGYGFGDKGINTRLTHWLFQNYSKKMIIIHPDKESLIKNSRGSFKINVMTEHYKHPKVELIEKRFEEVKIEEIKKYCA